jgi:hypothetical protein
LICFTDGFYEDENFIEEKNEIKGIEVGWKENVDVKIFWDTGVIAKYPEHTEEEVVHSCVKVEIYEQNGDTDKRNNWGQENCDVHGCKPETITDTIEIPFPVDNPTGLTDGIKVEVPQQKNSIWEAAEIVLPELPLYSEGTAILRLIPKALFALEENGYSEKFQLVAKRKDTGEIIGGLEIEVVIDDPPILDWTGATGYVDDAVEPDEGNAGEVFTFKAKYTDKNNDAPALGTPLLYVFKGDELIKGAPFLMEEENPTDTEYTDGKIYTSSITLSEPGDDYTYLIWVRDSYGVPAEGLRKDGPAVLPEKQLLTGVHSTFTMYCGSVHLYVRVVNEEHSGVIYDIEILPENQQPLWDDVEGIEAPEGWNFEKIGNGVRFYTETNPLIMCHRTKFTFRVTAKRISWHMRIHVTDQNHQNMGIIISRRWYLYYYPV